MRARRSKGKKGRPLQESPKGLQKSSLPRNREIERTRVKPLRLIRSDVKFAADENRRRAEVLAAIVPVGLDVNVSTVIVEPPGSVIVTAPAGRMMLKRFGPD